MAIKGAGTYNSKVNNSTIIANRAVSNGGGAARGTLINCIISGNTVIGSYSSGGGIDEVVAYNCVICDNTAVATCGGGGGANGGMLNNCTISGNQAAWLGGGINRATADHCTIISNSANPSGGGEGGGAAGSMLTSCNIIANSAGSAGGGVNNCTINNCVISGNNSNRGGGIYRAIANNCTIIRNSSMTEAGGAYASTLRNSIIWSNLTVGAGNNYFSSTLEYSCTLPLSIGTGNISADPQFVGSTLTLPDISPCVDVGNNAYAPLPNDIMSNPRIIGGRVDMGAYENTRYLPYYPNVCLTSVPVEVSYEIKTMIVAGTNNQYVSGMMWFTNSLYIADATSFLATTSWVTPEMHLSVGVNNIVIHGSNVYKDISVAVLPIVRG
ncbi:MAG: hypothetical protein NTV22_01175, partial [bacterium]|nr:hypothetical protein [bacterium]